MFQRITFTLLAFTVASSCARGIAPVSPQQAGRFRTPDGAQLAYRVLGTRGDTLVFLHGGPGQNSNIGLDLAKLAVSHVLILYDQRGSGLSDAGPDTALLSAMTHVADLDVLRRHFSLERMTLIGHSWGAMLAALYIDAHAQRVERLLLIAPGPPTHAVFVERFAALARRDSVGQSEVARLRASLERAPDPAAICRRIVELNDRLYFADSRKLSRKQGDYCDVPVGAFHKQALTARRTLASLGDWDLRPLLSRIAVPALIVEGALTPIPMIEIETWARSIPNARVLLVPASGHAYPFLEQPDVFFPAVETFLQGRWPEGTQ
ncbi:MAG: alpha/beta fold hydrolase [Gemmatimonadota bacterium]